jgi:hypothetical protein
VTADYQLVAVSLEGGEVRRVVLGRAWLAALFAEGFALRTADVGHPALVTVAALSPVELERVNAAARRRAEAEAAPAGFEHLRANALRCCDAVDDVLRWAGPPRYSGPWFLVEGVDID